MLENNTNHKVKKNEHNWGLLLSNVLEDVQDAW